MHLTWGNNIDFHSYFVRPASDPQSKLKLVIDSSINEKDCVSLSINHHYLDANFKGSRSNPRRGRRNSSVDFVWIHVFQRLEDEEIQPGQGGN